MKKNYVLWISLCLAFAVAGWAQSTPSSESSGWNGSQQSASQSTQSMSPAKIIWISREEVKPARGATHEKVEAAYARLWEKAKAEPYISLDSVSGDNESLFISAYDSFAGAERDFKIFSEISNGPLKSDYNALALQEADLINGTRSTIAVYHPELSYLGDRFMGRLPKSRYVQVETFHVRPGKDGHFAEGARLYQEAYKKLNIEEPWLIYRVISGAPDGTYLLFATMSSLADLDTNMARESRVHEEMGEQMKNMMQGADEIFASMQTNIYSLNPRTSHVSKEFAAADPDFWTKPASEVSRLARADWASDPAVIRKVQETLNTLGYDCGSPDGMVGPQTQSALRRFQKENGLSASGMIDRQTSKKLGM